MIIPRYWAEGRVRHRTHDKQITVRRFGWSDASEAEAQANADARTNEALQRILAGETLGRREQKVPYDGEDGLPIREQIVDRRGEAIVTRNSYGSLCLNTPDVFFADIDHESLEPRWKNQRTPCLIATIQFVSLLAGVALLSRGHLPMAPPFILVGILLTTVIERFRRSAHRAELAKRGGVGEIAMQRIRDFIAANPSWNLRIYQTPAGLRLLATHQLFNPTSPEVHLAFEQLGTDPMFARMCRRQNCFRARVSPKYWRIGIKEHLKPRPGVWPVARDRMPAREAWITRYESASQGFASCKFLEAIGSGIVSPDVIPVQHWHDELSRAGSGLPLA